MPLQSVAIVRAIRPVSLLPPLTCCDRLSEFSFEIPHARTFPPLALAPDRPLPPSLSPSRRTTHRSTYPSLANAQRRRRRRHPSPQFPATVSLLPSAKAPGRAPPSSPSIQAVPVDFPPGSDCKKPDDLPLSSSLSGCRQRELLVARSSSVVDVHRSQPTVASPYPRRLLSRRVCDRSRPYPSSFPPPSPASLSLSRLEARRVRTASRPDSSSASPLLSPLLRRRQHAASLPALSSLSPSVSGARSKPTAPPSFHGKLIQIQASGFEGLPLPLRLSDPTPASQSLSLPWQVLYVFSTLWKFLYIDNA